ncbi:MAG: amidohydrolase family protein [Candidatus Thorarchaeota archaeon]
MDIGITNTWLLTFSGHGLGIVKDGAVGIEDGKIVYIGETKDFPKNQADILIDGTNHITMPGLVNAHIHTGITILRGGAQDLPEIEWMNKGIGPISKHLQKEDTILGAKLGVLEAIKSGTTTFAEYASDVENLVKEVYKPYGIRVIATETINEVSRDRAHLKPTDIYDFDHNKGEIAFRKAKALFSTFSNEELITNMFGPQALDMISLDLLSAIQEEAKEKQSKIHMHVAQGQRERIQIKGRYGKESSTVSVLDKHGFLNENLIAAHNHDTSEEERKLMVDKKVKFVCCPNSISMIDGIVPPVGHLVSLGGKVGLGSDQAPGPGLHNMFSEMRTISLLTKTLKKDPTALPAWEVLQLGTIGGANILGLENKIGSLEIGKQADIITIDFNKPNLTPIIERPFHNFIPNIIYSATGYEVNDVIINGKLILADGKFTEINEQEIITNANKRAQQIFDEATDDWKKAGSKMVKDSEMGML